MINHDNYRYSTLNVLNRLEKLRYIKAIFKNLRYNILNIHNNRSD